MCLSSSLAPLIRSPIRHSPTMWYLVLIHLLTRNRRTHKHSGFRQVSSKNIYAASIATQTLKMSFVYTCPRVHTVCIDVIVKLRSDRTREGAARASRTVSPVSRYNPLSFFLKMFKNFCQKECSRRLGAALKPDQFIRLLFFQSILVLQNLCRVHFLNLPHRSHKMEILMSNRKKKPCFSLFEICVCRPTKLPSL